MGVKFSGFVLILAAAGASAQQLEPRLYSNAPVGMNFAIAGYTHSSGGLAMDPSLPVENAELELNAPILAYARSFGVRGQSAKFDAVLAGGCLSGSAEANGVLLTRDVCGMLDPAVRVSVNLYGAPAMTLEEFRGFRQDLIVGVSLQVVAPLGQYDAERLVNLGTNRWTFRPEVGASKKVGSFTFEASLGASLFTKNDDFFGGQTREQAPVIASQVHVVYEFRGGSWLALNATYYEGGRTTVDGVKRNDELGNSRLGATFALPVDRQHSLKFSASEGVTVRHGEDFRTLAVAWQYRWGGGL